MSYRLIPNDFIVLVTLFQFRLDSDSFWGIVSAGLELGKPESMTAQLPPALSEKHSVCSGLLFCILTSLFLLERLHHTLKVNPITHVDEIFKYLNDSRLISY